ncbi:MAG: VWA domain-containing protein [Blastocatellia bacterium]|nr:VWA domain-containing protein [Blastocatellia bacterium]
MTIEIHFLTAALALVITLSGLPTSASNAKAQQQRAPVVTKTPAPQKPASGDSEPEAEVVRVETDLVNTLFTAVDKDRHFVTSLRAEDVRIFENDVPQTVSMFQRETDRPLSLAILIDTSESQKGVMAEEKRAARAFVDSVIRSGIDRAAVLSFTGVPRLEQALTSDPVCLRQGIEQVRVQMSPENERLLAAGEDPLPIEQDPSGYTSIWDAMWITIQEHLSKTPDNTRRAIILLSDGDDTASRKGKQEVIDLAVKSDVVIYSIGIRDADFPEGKLDAGALRKVSDKTGGRAFIPAGPGDLTQAFSQIDQELRSQYLIAYSPTNKNRDGSYRRLRIEITNPELRKQKLQLLYRQGYYAKK